MCCRRQRIGLSLLRQLYSARRPAALHFQLHDKFASCKLHGMLLMIHICLAIALRLSSLCEQDTLIQPRGHFGLSMLKRWFCV